MKKMTETNVKDAFAGESQAHVRYLSYSEKAAAEGRPNIARAFKAGAFSEQVHATNHLGAVFDCLLRMRSPLRAGEALADDLGVLVDQNAHRITPSLP